MSREARLSLIILTFYQHLLERDIFEKLSLSIYNQKINLSFG